MKTWRKVHQNCLLLFSESFPLNLYASDLLANIIIKRSATCDQQNKHQIISAIMVTASFVSWKRIVFSPKVLLEDNIIAKQKKQKKTVKENLVFFEFTIICTGIQPISKIATQVQSQC